MKTWSSRNSFFHFIQLTTAGLLILFGLGCDQPQRSLQAKNRDSDPRDEKPKPIPPNYDPNQFSVNSAFIFREIVQSMDDGKNWSEVQKDCYLWITKEVTANGATANKVTASIVTFEIGRQLACQGDYLKEWRRKISFVNLSGEVISDQIFKGTETINGELNNKTIAPIFFTNRQQGLNHQLLKEFKIDQTIYSSAFRIENSVYWNNPDSPFHSLRLFHIAPGAKGSNMRTLISLVEAHP